ncbi:MAG: ROK family transcriptional regulator [Sphingomonas sp.]
MTENMATSLASGTDGITRNERRVLGQLFRRKTMTQLALAEALEITQQSASRIVSTLCDSGSVQLAGSMAPGKRGYPSNGFTLVPNFAHSVGVSVMSDALSMVVLDFTGALVAQRSERLARLPINDVLDWTTTQLESICVGHGIVQVGLVGIGVAIAGSFIETGGFNTPFELDDWAGVDVAGVFSDRFKLPAYADNDGNAAAIAESILGVGKWASSFAYLYIAAGVGGGVVLNGELWRGRFGNAGEFAGGLPPNIYPFPNLELLRQLVAAQGVAVPTVDALLHSFDPSWPAIDDWVARVRTSLSIIASNASAILDLEAVVLGGRIPLSLAKRAIPEIEIYDQRRRAVPRPRARIVPAEASGEVAAIGAAILPLTAKLFL